MHYESYHWRDHAPNPDRRRVDLALTIVFALVFSIGGLESLVGGHDMPKIEAQLEAQATLDVLQLAEDGTPTHTACRG
jgi:hypothetical protein